MKIKSIITALLMLVSLANFSQANKHTDEEKLAEYQNRVRQAQQLDYSMPDYSISKIDSKVMGPRLAVILNKIMEGRGLQTTIAALSVIQSNQIEGLNYGRIKDIKLDKVSKHDNEITVIFISTLDRNNLNLKKSRLAFSFIDGVSENVAANDFLPISVVISRIIKEIN